MPVLNINQNKNVWDVITKEYEAKRDLSKKKEDIIEFDPAKHSPVFYGYSYVQNKLDDESLIKDIDVAISHPVCFGYSLQPYVSRVEAEIKTKINIDPKKCTERQFIENFVFPTLLPALEKMLAEAKLHKCFERKRTAFNACDFITQYLYQNNPLKSEDELKKRKRITLNDIPFVKEWLAIHPRPALPKSLIWTETEAANIIQAFFRGYLVRRDPEVQELRKWQRELREENQNITQRVEKFWNDSSNQLKKSFVNENGSNNQTLKTL